MTNIMLLIKRLQEIQGLKERSNISEKIDDYIDEAIRRHKREHLLNSLISSRNMVLNSAKRTMSIFGLPEHELLAHSQYQMWWRGGKPREGYITTPIQSNPFHLDNKVNIKLLREYDSQDIRIVYLDEFKERCETLFEAVKKGELDDLFSIPPFEILHTLNGRHGELLPMLNIDPMKSRIYRVEKV